MSNLRSTLLSLSGLLALTLAMFGDLLFAGGTRVFGHQDTDLFLQYYAWRDFGFRELAKGNLALWNPYIFGGAPFFGGMQGGLLYPPNWLFLILPIATAINWTLALNVFLIGAFMFFWMRVRGLLPAASFFASAIVMFSGPHFFHVFGGHLPHLAAMAWSPLVFCAIDGFLNTRKAGWCFLGILAVTLQISAGFPQYVCYIAITAGLYAVLRLIQGWDWRLAIGLLGIYLGGAILSAVQLLTAVQATNETVRGVRLPFEFASQCGFPPENFITLIAPDFLGDIAHYWGRCYLWETSLFITVTALILAIFGAIAAERAIRWTTLTVIFASLILALGVYTPLFAFLYAHVPGFDRFRSISKFILPAGLFITLLAATGLDLLFRRRKIGTRFIIAVVAGAVMIAIAGGWVANTSSWPGLMNRLYATGETYLVPQLNGDPEFGALSQHRAAVALFLSAGTCALVAILLVFSNRSARLLYAIVALGILEAFYFARSARPTFDLEAIVDPREKSFLADHPGDYRILNPLNPNSAMVVRVPDLWGYDPNVVRRYAEFITWTQGLDPNNATLYVKFARFEPLYSMLRLGYLFIQHGGEFEIAESPVPPMPHLQLVSDYQVVVGRDLIFDALRREGFDPNKQVILETEPDFKPQPADRPGNAKIVEGSTDWMTIEADLNSSSILLITDVYTPAWRAISLPGSMQSSYQLLSANYVLRAIPLSAGHHRLRVEYAPLEFTIGKWISIVGGFIYTAGLIFYWRRQASA